MVGTKNAEEDFFGVDSLVSLAFWLLTTFYFKKGEKVQIINSMHHREEDEDKHNEAAPEALCMASVDMIGCACNDVMKIASAPKNDSAGSW